MKFAFLALAHVALSLLSFLLAQASAIDPSIWSLAANGATVVVLVWYVVYDVRVRTPSMLAAFAAEQAATRATFSATATKFSEEQAETRAAFAAEQAAIRTAFASEQKSLIERQDREIAEWRKMLFETMQSMRTAVHDVKDTAQVLINKQAIAAAAKP